MIFITVARKSGARKRSQQWAPLNTPEGSWQTQEEAAWPFCKSRCFHLGLQAGWSLGQQIRSELVCGGESRLGEHLSTGTSCLHSLPLEEGSCKADTENLIGREEARFQRGLNPTQRSLGFIQ